MFGLNDFDETLPGPFEYDLKRMAASFTIAARNNGFSPAEARAVTVESVKAYRESMAKFAEMRTLDVWYAHMSEQRFTEAMRAFQDETAARQAGQGQEQQGQGGKKQEAWQSRR